MMYGYLAAAVALAAIPLGAVGLLLMMDVMGGSWRANLRPAALRIAALLPWAMLAFLPLAAAVLIHPPAAFAPRPEWTAFRAAYLNAVFVVLRTAVYAVIWTVLPRAAVPDRRPGRAAVGLVVFTVTVTLAAVDWIMATDAAFSSSIFGLLFLAHAVLAGLAAAITLTLLRDPGRPSHGALLLSALLIWAYMHAMQFLIFWTGDKPDDARWYMMRGAGLWGAVLVLIAAFGLLLPFAALLSSPGRSDPRVLRPVCAAVLGALALECFWLVMPAHDGGWMGAAAGVLICGGIGFAALRHFAVRAS
jgi:hypothetical protein